LVNPRLVICLLLSTAVGIGSATLAVASGWGLLAGLAIWSVGGAICLVATSVAAVALEDLVKRRAAREKPQPASSPAHA
jgi:hypothetical protein